MNDERILDGRKENKKCFHKRNLKIEINIEKFYFFNRLFCRNFFKPLENKVLHFRKFK
jgi:hypothetical protein